MPEDRRSKRVGARQPPAGVIVCIFVIARTDLL